MNIISAVVKEAIWIGKQGGVFSSQEALDKYLKEHPGADKSLHTVKPSNNPADKELDGYDDHGRPLADSENVSKKVKKLWEDMKKKKKDIGTKAKPSYPKLESNNPKTQNAVKDTMNELFNKNDIPSSSKVVTNDEKGSGVEVENDVDGWEPMYENKSQDGDVDISVSRAKGLSGKEHFLVEVNPTNPNSSVKNKTNYYVTKEF